MNKLPVFVAEVSSNHNNDLDRCLAFVDQAAVIGCDAVKFQLFKLDKLFTKKAIIDKELAYRRHWELNPAWLPAIKQRCVEREILFGCTLFDIDSVTLLENAGVDFIKIASYNILDYGLLKRVALTRLPLVIATGMATIAEINKVLDVVRLSDTSDITLLHCVSDYPTHVYDANLRAINTLRTITGLPVGWSDHTVSPAVIYRAVLTYNASMVEFHLDLDGSGDEYKLQHCWLPKNIATVISTLIMGYFADGDGIKGTARL